jgi:chemotaxis response regulator CheB
MNPGHDATRSLNETVARSWTSVAASATLLDRLHVSLTKSQAAVDASRREVRLSIELIQRLRTSAVDDGTARTIGDNRSHSPAMDSRPLAVAIAASAGGIAALPVVLSVLPADLQATIFIAQHIRPDYPSRLNTILQRSSALPCAYATHGDVFRSGRIYLSPPDMHLELDAERMYLSGTDRVCHVRPSADVLFRSVAAAFGDRAIGVVLTGYLNDGAAGLRAIANGGGVTVVQDPEEAYARGMPENALKSSRVHHCLRLRQIGPALQHMIEDRTVTHLNHRSAHSAPAAV